MAHGRGGVRRDGGDADRGLGLDVGGVVVAHGRTGLSTDVRVRLLLVHEAAGLRERGMAVMLGYDPTPRTPLG